MAQHSADQQPGQIASSRSARVAASRKLLRRSARRSASAFLADGPQAVREALTYHAATAAHPVLVRVQEVFVDTSVADRHAELLELAQQCAVPVRYADATALASLSEAVTPQGIVARCALLDVPLAEMLDDGRSHTFVDDGRSHTFVDDGRRPVETSQDRNADEHGGPRLIAVPVEVRDPGNLGTIIRCADASGADGVAVLGDSVDIYNSKTVRATAGSLFHLPIASEADPVAGIEALKAAGLRVIATEGEASTNLDDLIDAGGLDHPTAWLFGNEAHGLPDDIAALADVRVSIPIRGLAESLNLSTAAAICLFASARAHR